MNDISSNDEAHYCIKLRVGMITHCPFCKTQLDQSPSTARIGAKNYTCPSSCVIPGLLTPPFNFSVENDKIIHFFISFEINNNYYSFLSTYFTTPLTQIFQVFLPDETEEYILNLPYFTPLPPDPISFAKSYITKCMNLKAFI